MFIPSAPPPPNILLILTILILITMQPASVGRQQAGLCAKRRRRSDCSRYCSVSTGFPATAWVVRAVNGTRGCRRLEIGSGAMSSWPPDTPARIRSQLACPCPRINYYGLPNSLPPHCVRRCGLAVRRYIKAGKQRGLGSIPPLRLSSSFLFKSCGLTQCGHGRVTLPLTIN